MSAASYAAWVVKNRERRRELDRLYRERNLDKCKERDRRKRLKSGDKIDARVKKWCAANTERRREHQSKWKKNNRHLVNSDEARRRAIKLAASVPWADQEKIAAIYREAARLTLLTGIKHHVDHIIPLRGRLVCGFHHEGNLQILVDYENYRKNNAFVPFVINY